MSGRIATVAVLAGALLAAAPAQAQQAGAAARVDGVVIPRERLDRHLEAYLAARGRSVAAIQSPASYKQLLREALDQLVAEALLAAEARRRGHGPTDDEVAAEVARRRAGFDPPVRFQLELERAGFTEATFAAHVRDQLSIERLVARDLGPAAGHREAEVVAALQALVGELRGRARVEVLVPLGPSP